MKLNLIRAIREEWTPVNIERDSAPTPCVPAPPKHWTSDQKARYRVYLREMIANSRRANQ